MNRIATPAKTREILTKYGFALKRSLGQNFLIEPKFIDKIARVAALNNHEIVVEIGPGIGALTQALAAAAGHVVAIEVDGALIPVLEDIFAEYSNVTVIHDNALKVDFNGLIKNIREQGNFKPGCKVVANLPYYITTPVIMRLLEEKFDFSSMVLMVQKEVAQRISAKPGTKDYGALSLGVQYYCIPTLVTIVPKTVFLPRPKVESAVIKLEKRERPPVDVNDETLFFQLIKAAFGQRRKTLLNAFNNSGILKTKEQWHYILMESGIVPQRRGETLTLQEFARLANHLAAKR